MTLTYANFTSTLASIKLELLNLSFITKIFTFTLLTLTFIAIGLLELIGNIFLGKTECYALHGRTA